MTDFVKLRQDANKIIEQAIAHSLPAPAVKAALKARPPKGRIHMLSLGKAGWHMARAAHEVLGDSIAQGMVITKHGHSEGALSNFDIFEGGHPIPDIHSINATQAAINMARSLGHGDELLFMISGGGSALFEAPVDGISLEDIMQLTEALLASGADITEINAIRKRLSTVKGGRFAELCAPAHVRAIILSDVLGDRLDSIASGPTVLDKTTCEEAFAILDKYRITPKPHIINALNQETPKAVNNSDIEVVGSVSILCEAAATAAAALGYKPNIITSSLDCEANEAGRFMAAIARDAAPMTAIIAGGETVVRLTGNGKGGRNQQLALAAARGIADKGILLLSLGSDGTDGPTDAAGGMVDGQSLNKLKTKGINLDKALENNDAYNALAAIDGLIKTGPTGTNVNDVIIALTEK